MLLQFQFSRFHRLLFDKLHVFPDGSFRHYYSSALRNAMFYHHEHKIEEQNGERSN